GPALRACRVAGLVEGLRVEPTDDLSAAARPERVALVGRELQVMRREARVDERVVAGLGLVQRELARGSLEREELRGRMIGAPSAECRILGAADARRVPHSTELIEHLIMRIRTTVPDALVVPVWGGLQGQGLRGRRRVRVADGRVKARRGVGDGVEDRELVGGKLRRAVDPAVAVD